MEYPSLSAFLQDGLKQPAKAPVALIIVEDEALVDETITYHVKQGFGQVVAVAHPDQHLSQQVAEQATIVRHDVLKHGAEFDVVNQCIAKAPGTWFYYGYNTEFLFYPFCETRSVNELVVFHTEERRSAFLSYVIDLYANDLNLAPDAVSMDLACLDRSGYYALTRKRGEVTLDRQLDFFGGLRWRFEEHIPVARRKIDRIALFKAKEGLVLRNDYTFNDEEYNTYSCPWHHNITSCIASFRVAKALKRNPGSTFDIHNFTWRNSAPFEWHSQQLLDLGLMESGQWF